MKVESHIHSSIPKNVQGLLQRLRAFDDRMADIIEARFGVLDGREHTLEEIGIELNGLSRERVRQIEKRALESLRKSAQDNSDPEAYQTLWAIREAARQQGKRNKVTSPPLRIRSVPTTERLISLRDQVNDGMLYLQSLGITV